MTILSRSFALVVLAIALCSCATTPQNRFAEFYEISQHSENIDVVIDTLILSDISGSDVGIDEAKNLEAMPLVEAAVQHSFTARGFKPNLVFHGNGATFRKDEKTNYVYATDWTGTERTFEGHIYAEHEQTWANPDVQTFLHRLSDHAKDANKKPRKASSSGRKRRALVPPLTADEIPQAIMAMPSNLLVFVNVSGAEVSKGKSVGTAVATGLLTAALTGGMYVQASAPMSGSQLEIIVFDKQQSRVVWHNVGQGQRYTEVAKAMDAVMKTFPTVTGELHSTNGKRPI